MEKEDSCDTGLSLGLGLPANLRRRQPKPPPPPLEPSLTLSLSEEIYGSTTTPKEARLSSPHSTISSFSTTNYIKKEKLDVGGEETEVERGSSLLRSREEDDEAAARKKLRLTKEQSALLEDRFKEHSTLNPKQKQTLAKQLNLRARQIEVWFQNRRARTKLKQTEVDCEFLRRCCETLTEENRRLQKELQELRAIKFSAPPPPLFMQLPAATLMVCPSCERIAGAGVGAANKADGKDISGGSFMKPTQHLFNPFAHSATC
ncbi:homeobox-leucine zipper protein HOX19 [Dendrobium catenatum]|uniref:Homeobox-leucine zipper protein HOX19 n=1 Tax=Dendrobium catenatum TaxID=906689 RepID=A0A2I0WRV5_9ASPA|nr:homeobox-leucine zipper protein HOX19 [Dendrobium catenatum]PKU78384.1 Homeobox-leucine zipper protein HOX19 [Dendrobium catenatum]